jgi:formate-dependent nitrite reductase membrane component NrfD
MEGTIFVFWNWTVALYLFIAGVSAGAFAISAIAYFLGRNKYETISRLGAYIAPFPLLAGILCLIFDLERPSYFWKLMITLQPFSVMSLGAWLLLIFSFLSFLYFYLWLPDRYDLWRSFQNLPPRWSKFFPIRALQGSSLLAGLRREKLNGLRDWVAFIGIPVSLFVGIYTGVLLGALVARPFWNNPMLPMVFLLSAMKTGTASICFWGCFVKGFRGMSRDQIETNKFMIHAIDFILMIFSIIAISLFVFGLYVSTRSSAEAARLIMGGDFTFLFWGLVVGVGIFLPFGLELYELSPRLLRKGEMRAHSPWLSGVVTASVLLGGFTLRYVVVYAGQMAKIVA